MSKSVERRLAIMSGESPLKADEARAKGIKNFQPNKERTMEKPESKTKLDKSWPHSRVTIRVPNRSDQLEIENAVRKINKEALGGAKTVISVFIREAAVKLARDVNGTS